MQKYFIAVIILTGLICACSPSAEHLPSSKSSSEIEITEVPEEDIALFDAMFEEENLILDESIRQSTEHRYFLQISITRNLWITAQNLECSRGIKESCMANDTKISLEELSVELEEISNLYKIEKSSLLSPVQSRRRLELIQSISKRLKTFGPDRFTTEKPDSLIELMR